MPTLLPNSLLNRSVDVPVRQTVIQGPVDANGAANFLPLTSANINLTSSGVGAGLSGLVVTAAKGVFGLGGLSNKIGISNANLTWNGLTNNQLNFLYVAIQGDGSLTTGATILPPVYSSGNAPSTVNGQYTFIIPTMTMYLGNGSVANIVDNIVFVGESQATGGAIVSSITYALNGMYEGPWIQNLPGVNVRTTSPHNIGVTPRYGYFQAECTATDGTFVIPDQIGLIAFKTGTGGEGAIDPRNRTTISTIAGSASSGWCNGVATVLTQNSWKRRHVANRGW